MHNEWVERHAKAEKYMDRYQLPAVGEDGLTVEEFMKRSEQQPNTLPQHNTLPITNNH